MTYTEYMTKALIVTALENKEKEIKTDEFVLQAIDNDGNKSQEINIFKEDLSSSLSTILTNKELLKNVKTISIYNRTKDNKLLELTSIEIN